MALNAVFEKRLCLKKFFRHVVAKEEDDADAGVGEDGNSQRIMMKWCLCSP